NWTTALRASTVAIRNAGKITHAASATNAVESNTNRVYIVASNVTINAGGSIDVSKKGYAGGRNGSTPPRGEGPGGGRSSGTRGGGGGYGGAGGTVDSTASGGVAYGSEATPLELGSGAGG